MNQAQDRIIRIARKLFALAAKSGTYEEAHSAAMKARALLSEYHLSMTDVELASAEAEMECREERRTLTTPHIPSWVKVLFGGVRRGFGCDGFLSMDMPNWQTRGAVVFIGVEPDLSLAAFTFDYLYRVGKRCPGMAKKKERAKNQWRMGFAMALSDRLKRHQSQALTAQENALVPVKESLIAGYMERVHPDLVAARPAAKPRRVTNAFRAGFVHGRTIALNTPIESGQKPLAIAGT
jgi:hypothetical protein